MIVEDSYFKKNILTDFLKSIEFVNKIDIAGDGQIALKKLESEKPDVILLDLELPNMDGITFLQKMLEKGFHIPCIITSSYEKNSQVVYDAISEGAVDYFSTKNSNSKQDKIQKELKNKIMSAINLNPKLICKIKKPTKHILGNNSPPKRPIRHTVSNVIVIGASTGGPKIIREVLSQLPNNLPAGILLIQHMRPFFIETFCKNLQNICKMKVEIAKEGSVIKAGTILVAPGNFHMLVNSDHTITLNQDEKRLGVRPSISVTMISASEVFGENTTGVLLTGLGYDGGFGIRIIKNHGGHTIIQDPKSSEAESMPQSAMRLNSVDCFLPANKIASHITETLLNNPITATISSKQ